MEYASIDPYKAIVAMIFLLTPIIAQPSDCDDYPSTSEVIKEVLNCSHLNFDDTEKAFSCMESVISVAEEKMDKARTCIDEKFYGYGEIVRHSHCHEYTDKGLLICSKGERTFCAKYNDDYTQVLRAPCDFKVTAPTEY